MASVNGNIMHILGAGEQPRRLLEGAISGEWHPVRREIVRNVDGGGSGALVEHGKPLACWGSCLLALAIAAQAISFVAGRERWQPQ